MQSSGWICPLIQTPRIIFQKQLCCVLFVQFSPFVYIFDSTTKPSEQKKQKVHALQHLQAVAVHLLYSWPQHLRLEGKTSYHLSLFTSHHFATVTSHHTLEVLT